MHSHFKLSAEVILELVFAIRGKELVGADVANKDGVVALNGTSLLLKTEVGVKVIDDPGVVESRVFCSDRSLLLACNR